jgi:predicted N-acetyltransferase YhbS
MADITIRKMREEDRPAVMEILGRWNMAPITPSPELPDPERSTIAADGTAIVATVGDRIVGVASYILHGEGQAETASLAVDPAWRGKGVGERLQAARLAALKARGVKYVRTECDRPEVVAWYCRKFGYRSVGTTPKKHPFSLAGVDHWTVLELDLSRWVPTA